MYRRIASVVVAGVALALAGVMIVASPATAGIRPSGETSVDRGIVVSIPEDSDGLYVDLSYPAETIFSLALYENGSTGYSWSYTSSAESDLTVTYLDTDFVYPPGEILPGSGGTRYFRFVTAQPGYALITLSYQRPWESEPIQQVFVAVWVF